MRRLALAATLLVPAAPLPAQDDPALPRCPPGWSVEVAARFPDVRHPTVLCAAPDGRIFVGEDPQDMEGPVDRPINRVLCFHPDGRRTVFTDGLGAVFGLLYLDGKVFIHHAPRFTVYRDDDGVGCDPVDLLSATHPEPWRGNRYNTHIPSGFRLAMDGFFYLAVGDKGIPGAVGQDGSRAVLHGGGVLRFRPDGTSLEVFATGTRTFMDIAVGAEDDLFAWDNDDNVKWGTRVLHLVEAGDYGYPWDRGKPGTLGELHLGRGVPAGALAWTEDGLPPEYSDTIFFCEWGRSQIVRTRVAREGAGWKLVSHEPFITRGTEEFRPVGIAATPDGRGFLVADWNTEKRLTRHDAGRLLRFTFAGPSPAAPRPPWFVAAASGRPFEATTGDLIQALRHPAREVRLTAQRRLSERKDAAEALKRLVADAGAPPLSRMHALWALDGRGEGMESALVAAKAEDPGVRHQALRLLSLRRPKESVPAFAAALRDPDAGARFAAATGLGRAAMTGAAPALVAALGDPDPLVRHAAASALGRIGRAEPAAWDEVARALRSGDPRIREGAEAALRDAYDVRAVQRLAEAASDASLAPEGRAAAVRALAGIRRRDPPWDGSWWGTRPALNPKPPKTADWEGTAASTAALRAALDDPDPRVALAAVEGARDTADAGASAPLRALFGRARNSAVRGAILDALETLRDPDLGPLAAGVLGDPALSARAARLVRDPVSLMEAARREESPDVLVPVLEALARHGAGAPEAAARLKHPDAAVRRAAAGVLGRTKTVAPLLGALDDPDAGVRRAAIVALSEIRSRDAVPALLRAADDAAVRREAVDALARTPDLRALDLYLEGLNERSPYLRSACRSAIAAIAADALPQIEKRLATLPPGAVAELQKALAGRPEAAQSPLLRTPAPRPGPDAYLEAALARAGDPRNGRTLYEDPRNLGCPRCHTVDGRGGDIGPEMSLVGAFYDRSTIAESILYPSRVVAGGYRQLIVQTKDGEVLSGQPRRETADELVLADGEGQLHSIRKADIEERRLSDVSPMPEGLADGLSPEEFADLVAYLESLKGETIDTR
jgi:putative heme-binding domain-containing protein